MNLYTRAHDAETCEKILMEAQDYGMLIDTPTYTTLINANYKSGNLKRCWEIYNKNIVNI